MQKVGITLEQIRDELVTLNKTLEKLSLTINNSVDIGGIGANEKFVTKLQELVPLARRMPTT